MAPRETTPLVNDAGHQVVTLDKSFSMEHESNEASGGNGFFFLKRHRVKIVALVAGIVVAAIFGYQKFNVDTPNGELSYQTGPYALTQRHEGKDFFKYYNFFDGPDSLGSAGLNTYVGEEKAKDLGIVSLTCADGQDECDEKDQVVYMSSVASNSSDLRNSIRLEGKHRFNSGLFVLDLDRMPTGCGVWPAFWMTDEKVWPNHGEIDIVEGINTNTQAKTTLHTSAACDMYAHVPPFDKTGVWDTATGIPNTWTGQPDYETRVEADNCWVLAPHQWANMGCVAVSMENDTLGEPLNEVGGGVFALEWDPVNRYIRSWAFPRSREIPENLRNAVSADSGMAAVADPSTWGLPYAYFAIGEGTGCSADHFQNMHIVFNLAFCGNVAGNKFAADCPAETKKYAQYNGNGGLDAVATCNAYVKANADRLSRDAYWSVRGVYVFERTP